MINWPRRHIRVKSVVLILRHAPFKEPQVHGEICSLRL